MIEKAYTPPIAYSEKNYTEITKPNFINSLMQYGTLIVRYNSFSAGAGSTSIYQVPKGKTLYLLSASLYLDVMSPAVDTYGKMDLNPENVSLLVLSGYTAYDKKSITLSLPIPLKINQEQFISVYNLTNGCTTAGIILGYEIDNSLIPNFF